MRGITDQTGILNSAPYTISRNNLGPGTYQVSVSDADGCQQVFSYIITGPGLLTASISSVTNVSCFGGNDGALSVSISGGSPPYSYLWNTGDIIPGLSNLTAGTYRVTVSDNAGCTQSLSVNITQPSALIATGGAGNITACGASDGSIAITVSGGTPDYTYAWITDQPVFLTALHILFHAITWAREPISVGKRRRRVPASLFVHHYRTRAC